MSGAVSLSLLPFLLARRYRIQGETHEVENATCKIVALAEVVAMCCRLC